MEIASVSTLSKHVRSTDEQSAEKLITAYGDLREKKGINEAWEKARLIMRHIAKARKKRIKDCLLEMDEYSNVIGIVPFTQYFAGIEDTIRVQYLSAASKEEALAEINDMMYQLLDKVKIDRRLLASTNY